MHLNTIKNLGLLIVIGSLAFVAFRVWEVFPEIQLRKLDLTEGLFIFLIVCAYAFAVFFVSLAWQKLLFCMGEPMATFRVCQSVYSRSVIAKYVPLGVLEYAGRHVMAAKYGFSQAVVASANLWEIMCQVIAACVFILFAWFLYGNMQQSISVNFIFSISLIFIISAFGFNNVIKRIPFLANRIKVPSLKFSDVLTPMAFYTVFFMILGAILIAVISMVTRFLTIDEILTVLILSTFAWLLGYITPGAPAGLGVREAVLFFGLTEMIGEPGSLLVIGIFRMITVAGDLFYFIFGYCLSCINES